MGRPATFEDIATVASDDCRKVLGEGRALRLSFIAYRDAEPRKVELMLTYAAARDLVCSIVDEIGGLPEFRTLRVFRGVLEALRDFDEGMYGAGSVPEASEN